MDYLNPDYTSIFRRRGAMLQRLRQKPNELLPGIKAYYRANPIQFVSDWGMTTDPRNIERGLPAMVPFVPFPKQIEWLQWLLDRWQAGENGLTEKSRDAGCSVSAMSLFSALCIFNKDFVAGVGSRKEALVDGVGDPNTLFHKARTFLTYLPEEFRGGWSDKDKSASSHMKIIIPHTGSVIIGEAGDNIGRGGRASIYLLDESAHNRNQNSIDMALSQTTRCRIDLSSVNGTDNPFAEKRFSGRVPVFTFHWRDDPRKDDAWYEREKARLPAVIVAQEIDIDYNASKDNILIPSAWVQSAIDAHKVIGLGDESDSIAGLDVADTGDDTNALALRRSPVLTYLVEWSGNSSDLFATAERAALECDTLGCTGLRFDADGLGAGLRGDFRIINDREARTHAQIAAEEHRGSSSPVNPDEWAIDPDLQHGHQGRTNRDFFKNYKAQAWWDLRRRFERTHNWVTRGIECDPNDCIVLPASLPALGKLQQELSQPSYGVSVEGKIMVNKKPDGAKSPNLADAVVIAYAPTQRVKRTVGILL